MCKLILNLLLFLEAVTSTIKGERVGNVYYYGPACIFNGKRAHS